VSHSIRVRFGFDSNNKRAVNWRRQLQLLQLDGALCSKWSANALNHCRDIVGRVGFVACEQLPEGGGAPRRHELVRGGVLLGRDTQRLAQVLACLRVCDFSQAEVSAGLDASRLA